MEYEKILLELLMRVQTLEEKLAAITKQEDMPSEKQPGTSKIKQYILKLKQSAAQQGLSALDLVANDIHKALKLKSRMPAVCNAMKQCMNPGDTVLHETASGFSSTYSVRYKL